MPIAMPQQQRPDNGLNKLLTIGGAAAGAMGGGGVSGAMMGANAGQMAGGLLTPQQNAAPQAIETNALQRRQQSIDQSPLRQIRDSINSLQHVPDPAQRSQLAAPLMKAEYMAKLRGY